MFSLSKTSDKKKNLNQSSLERIWTMDHGSPCRERVSGSSVQSDPQKTEEAVDHRQNNSYVKAAGTSPLRSS